MERFDFFGQHLAVGDRVAYIDRHYQELRHGEVVKLNEKTVTLNDLDYDGPDDYKTRIGWGRTIRGYNCVVKQPITNKDDTFLVATISETIGDLQAIMKKHGDVGVYVTDEDSKSGVISVKPSFIDGKVQALVIA